MKRAYNNATIAGDGGNGYSILITGGTVFEVIQQVGNQTNSASPAVD
jgi:hypothetical protein